MTTKKNLHKIILFYTYLSYLQRHCTDLIVDDVPTAANATAENSVVQESLEIAYGDTAGRSE